MQINRAVKSNQLDCFSFKFFKSITRFIRVRVQNSENTAKCIPKNNTISYCWYKLIIADVELALIYSASSSLRVLRSKVGLTHRRYLSHHARCIDNSFGIYSIYCRKMLMTLSATRYLAIESSLGPITYVVNIMLKSSHSGLSPTRDRSTFIPMKFDLSRSSDI